LRKEWGLDSVVVPNGVNKKYFYPDGKKKHAIMIEGDDRNAAKDVKGMSWEIGYRLRDEYGVKLMGYSAIHNPHMDEFDEYVVGPTTKQMRRMYSQALFLLKASKYDGLAGAPVEAMCCCTPTVRAVVEGDDDLSDGKNCLLVPYDYDALYEAACRMMDDEHLRQKLTDGAVKYANEHLNWDDKIARLEKLYGGEE
jgi:glycosyltransferase involved in cell wall biosynthesis